MDNKLHDNIGCGVVGESVGVDAKRDENIGGGGVYVGEILCWPVGHGGSRIDSRCVDNKLDDTIGCGVVGNSVVVGTKRDEKIGGDGMYVWGDIVLANRTWRE